LPWRLLLRLRWKLAVLLVVVFVLGQIIAGVWTEEPLAWLLLDVLGWGAISGLTIWLSVVWASRREQRHQADLQAALRRQQELNRKLQRANSHLELLSQTNEHIAGSSTLDEILVSALLFPQRLVPAQAAALLLIDASGAIEIRSEGASSDDLARLRECFGIMPQVAERPGPRMLVQHAGTQPGCAMSACLVLPLHDGLAPLGWIELYLAHPPAIPDDELALLETIAREVAEAIISARRRSHEERAIYELERAIADERARIARDIHDGLAQSLAFVRMRVDLWQDWVEGDPQRLHDELAELKHTLRGQIRELRRAIFALRPLQFDELGFVGGLRRYIVEFSEQQAWDTHIDLKGAPPTLSLELEAVCFRIVQEALTNVAKHAAANRVEVTIDQIDRGMRVIVRDDGHGFEPSILSEGGPPGHVGLRQMYERLAAFRGQLTLLSRPGAGTELRVWIPLLQESTILSPHQAERA
jgi:signal transduction histidine kinase